ncbi:unnamed protein product [Rhizophagus irregularis]|uniref:Uncharacterized protein n=1 Tax=Rhizophagus irregularis TaxID=588596 RepID=A0A916EEU1_9GLOM|nr:unnamed protein product [Rhizophagus irregularis]CAB5376901.1 unnamed protein product [Rhizophagus irregularis]
MSSRHITAFNERLGLNHASILNKVNHNQRVEKLSSKRKYDDVGSDFFDFVSLTVFSEIYVFGYVNES